MKSLDRKRNEANTSCTAGSFLEIDIRTTREWVPPGLRSVCVTESQVTVMSVLACGEVWNGHALVRPEQVSCWLPASA